MNAVRLRMRGTLIVLACLCAATVCHAQHFSIGASAGVLLPWSNLDTRLPGFDWCVEANYAIDNDSRFSLHAAYESMSYVKKVTATSENPDGKELSVNPSVRLGASIALVPTDRFAVPYIRPSLLLLQGYFIAGLGIGVLLRTSDATQLFVETMPMMATMIPVRMGVMLRL